MSNEIDQFEIVEEGLGPLPEGAPADLRERLTLHLRTTDGETLAEAERDFQGRFVSIDEYVRSALMQHVAAWLSWVLDHAPIERLREALETETKRAIWMIPYGKGVLVFASARAGSARGRR